MYARRSILGWSLGALFLACAGTTAGGPGGSGSGIGGSSGGASGATTTNTATVAGFVAGYCDLYVPCCADAGLGTGQTCQTLVGALASRGTYNAAAALACLQEMQQASTKSDFCTNGGSGPSCGNVFSGGSGTKGPGQPCSQDGDCLAPSGGSAMCYLQTVSVDGGTASSGTCVQLTSGQPGQGPCFETISGNSSSSAGFGTSMPPPAQGYFCDLATGVMCNFTTQKCTALGTVGQACQGDEDCVASDYCLPFPTDTCAARVANGAPCAASSGNPCQTTSYCDTASQTCKPQLADGAACALDQQCPSGRCTNGKCTASGDSNSSLSLICGP